MYTTKRMLLGIIILSVTALQLSEAVDDYNSFLRRQIFPCTHPLRNTVPYFFTHCHINQCGYTGWSWWEVVAGITHSVPTSQCNSGEAYTEIRRRTATTLRENCNKVTKTRLVCMPDAATRLIIALRLGSYGQDYSPFLHPDHDRLDLDSEIARDSSYPYDYFKKFTQGSGSGSGSGNYPDNNIDEEEEFQPCPNSWHDQRICGHLVKRSVNYYDRMLNELKWKAKDELMVSPKPVPEDSSEHPVMKFTWEEHARRFRYQARPENCAFRDTRHILFVLDSSGSIGVQSYAKMKKAIAKLTPLFCEKVKFALMTFGSNLNLEFCFDCFENTYKGRLQASNAIKEAHYQSGLKSTGEAARCICEELLSTDCGISEDPSCLDVVFITDGQSNGRLQICDEIKCLHRKRGVNTYAIGINNFNQTELDCISGSNGSDWFSAFEFNSYEDFENVINKVVDQLSDSDENRFSSLTSLKTCRRV